MTPQEKETKLREAAKKYCKTLPGINYRSLYDFGTQNIAAFEKGAEWFEREYHHQEPKEVGVEGLKKEFRNAWMGDTEFDETSYLHVFNWFLPHLQPKQESDAVGGFIEIMKAAKQDAIEKQEQEQSEDYNRGREDAFNYALEMITKHSKFKQSKTNSDE